MTETESDLKTVTEDEYSLPKSLGILEAQQDRAKFHHLAYWAPICFCRIQFSSILLLPGPLTSKVRVQSM